MVKRAALVESCTLSKRLGLKYQWFPMPIASEIGSIVLIPRMMFTAEVSISNTSLQVHKNNQLKNG